MFRRKSLIIILLVVAVAITARSYLGRHYVVPIIMYHSVAPACEEKNRLCVTADTFARQMLFLRERNYNVIPLEGLAELIKNKKKIPPKTIVITMDDGYKNIYQCAFPMLKKYNLPAAVFIIVNEVGRVQNDRLSWEEIKAMQASGLINIGSHCFGPEPLVNLKDDALVKEEIFASKKILEEKLGSSIEFFSYPEGRFNAKIRQLVIDAGYRLAVSTRPPKGYPSDDLFALKRLRISQNSRNMFVFWFETTGYYTFLKESRRR